MNPSTPGSQRARSCRQAGVLFLLPLLPALWVAWMQEGFPWQTTSLSEDPWAVTETNWSRLDGEILWVDVRASGDYMLGHIPGAVSVPESSWPNGLEQVFDRWHPDVTIIVYCAGDDCTASRLIAERLREEAGLDNVHFLYGDWRKVTHPPSR